MTRSDIFFGITNIQEEKDLEVIRSDLNINGWKKNQPTDQGG